MNSFIRLFCISITAVILSFLPLRSRQQPLRQITLQQKVDALNLQAFNTYLTNPAGARKIAETALILSKKINYQTGIGLSFLSIGRTYWAQSYYPISLFYFNTALPYLQSSANGASNVSDCYRVIGRNYADMKNVPRAFYFFDKALTAAGNNLFNQQLIYSDRSSGYILIKQYKKAENDVFKALSLSHKTGNFKANGIMYSRLNTIYMQMGQLNKAKAYGDTAYTIAVKGHNKRLQAAMIEVRATLLYKARHFSAAAKAAQQALAMGDSIGVVGVSLNAIKTLSDVAFATNNYIKLLQYQKQYIALQDSLNKSDKENTTQLIQNYFALTAKLHEIERIEENDKFNRALIKSQRLTIFILIGAVVALIVAMYLLYRYTRAKNRLTKMLKVRHAEAVKQHVLIEEQAANLNDLNQTKDRLLGIIGHDLRSPLASVRTIVDMFDTGDLSSDEVQSFLKELNPALKGAELTLSNLVAWAGNQINGGRAKTENINIAAMGDDLMQVFAHPLNQKGINLLNQINPSHEALADENHVKTILRNLISNAIKFTAGGGSIKITTEQKGDRITIQVDDTGRGMSESEIAKLFTSETHFTTIGTHGESGTGIGLLLCRDLAIANNGRIYATSKVDKGSSFILELPLAYSRVEKEVFFR